ncbi:MAG: hypothetical protein JWN40_4684 [Phycisphaerales bacterium]|nr:hypothetical protein [Phycisphaerales bacterium]
MSPDAADKTPPARRSYGGRRALIGLLLIAAVSTFWWRSYRHCDLLAIFGPGGKVGGIVFLRGEFWVGMSNIGMAEPWTAQTASGTPQDGEELRELLMTSGTPAVARRWQFFVVSHHKDAFGLPGSWCSTAGGPAWALLPLGAWPVGTWMIRRGRQWRRRRRGWCLGCGYDLRGGADERCPECGETR